MPRPPHRKVRPTTLRVISGKLRGRKIQYHGDPATRPMRDSVRENLFNILSTTVVDALCWDLFAGTGALAIESISRGATRAVAIELDRTASQTLRQTLGELGLASQVEVITGDTFRLAPRLLASGVTSRPWVVFICPPYGLMDERPEAVVELVDLVLRSAPPGSQLVVEMEEHWSPEQLPTADWDLRKYGSTRLAFAEIAKAQPAESPIPADDPPPAAAPTPARDV